MGVFGVEHDLVLAPLAVGAWMDGGRMAGLRLSRYAEWNDNESS